MPANHRHFSQRVYHTDASFLRKCMPHNERTENVRVMRLTWNPLSHCATQWLGLHTNTHWAEPIYGLGAIGSHILTRPEAVVMICYCAVVTRFTLSRLQESYTISRCCHIVILHRRYWNCLFAHAFCYSLSAVVSYAVFYAPVNIRR